jgi:hypothetical protein
MKRSEPRRAFPVFGCSTRLDLYDPGASGTWWWTQHSATVGEAHTLAERPCVVVIADRFESPTGFRSTRGTSETGWLISAIGIIEDDAERAARSAVEELRADIAAGNIAKGAHQQWVPRNPLEPPVEAQLRAYRERVLRELGATV